MKDDSNSKLIPLVIITAGGLLALGICYLLYLLLYNFIEIQFFPSDPTSVPADTIRRTFTLILLILYLVLLRTKIGELPKATLLVGPMGLFTTTVILGFYEYPMTAIVAILGIIAFSTYLVYRYKKPWFYYFAIAVTVISAIALAWPRT